MKNWISPGKFFLVIAFGSLVFLSADAPRYRLRNFERAPDAGYVITSAAGGVAQWSQSGNGELNVNLTPIAYVPASTGNSSNLNETVIDPNGAVWIIDSNGDAIRVERNNGPLVASDIGYDGTEGLGADVAAALDSLDRRFNSPSGGGGTTSYALSGASNVIYSGDASDAQVTVTKTGPGNIRFIIPDGVNSFDIAVPSEYFESANDGTITATFEFDSGVPFNQSEATMRYPSAHLYSRATESSSGFDVELRGNNPQSRLLPFSTVGHCAHQFGGISAAGSTWSVNYRF